MTRTVTWLVLLAAVAATGGLFMLKNEVHHLEQALAREQAAIRDERAAIEVLDAEWSYVTRPARIAELARDTLGLTQLTAAQTLSSARLHSWALGESAPGETMPDETMPAAGGGRIELASGVTQASVVVTGGLGSARQ